MLTPIRISAQFWPTMRNTSPELRACSIFSNAAVSTSELRSQKMSGMIAQPISIGIRQP